MTLVAQFHTYERSHAEVLFYVCFHCPYEEKNYITKCVIGELIIIIMRIECTWLYIMIHVRVRSLSFPHFEEGVLLLIWLALLDLEIHHVISSRHGRHRPWLPTNTTTTCLCVCVWEGGGGVIIKYRYRYEWMVSFYSTPSTITRLGGLTRAYICPEIMAMWMLLQWNLH